MSFVSVIVQIACLNAYHSSSVHACHDTLHEVGIMEKEEVSGSLMICTIWWYIHNSDLAA